MAEPATQARQIQALAEPIEMAEPTVMAEPIELAEPLASAGLTTASDLTSSARLGFQNKVAKMKSQILTCQA